MARKKTQLMITLDKELLKVMDKKIVEHNYGTRSEFIREACRRLTTMLGYPKDPAI